MKTNLFNIILSSIIVLNMFCTGCQGDLTTYRFDEGVSQHHRGLAKRAAQIICEASEGFYCPLFFKSGDSLWRDREDIETNPDYVSVGRYKTNNWNKQSITILSTLTDEEYLQTSIHELSHQKCGHLSDGSIMEEYMENVTDDYNVISPKMIECLTQ